MRSFVVLVLGLSAVLLTAGCGGTEPAPAFSQLLERFCRYGAVSTEAEDDCVAAAAKDPSKLIHREEWGPRAQAVLYAIGEISSCLSRAGPRCTPGAWPPHRDESLLVERYCAYGAVSAARRRECLLSVDRAEVLARAHRANPTHAASYAIGDRTRCGGDAGTFCIERPFCSPSARPCSG